MEKLLISACILGISSRYDGKSKKVFDDEILEQLKARYELVPFCPEIYGGLPTPRVPSERIEKRVMMKDGRDVTENYMKGAKEALYICKLLGIRKALLKEKSPSCGKGQIYDGSFSGNLKEGNGVTADILIASGIEVFGESETYKLL